MDDTLFDNDALEAELRRLLQRDWHAAGRDRFWAIFEQKRSSEGYADFLGAVEQFRLEHETDPRVLELSQFLLDYPFAKGLHCSRQSWIRRRCVPEDVTFLGCHGHATGASGAMRKLRPARRLRRVPTVNL